MNDTTKTATTETVYNIEFKKARKPKKASAEAKPRFKLPEEISKIVKVISSASPTKKLPVTRTECEATASLLVSSYLSASAREEKALEKQRQEIETKLQGVTRDILSLALDDEATRLAFLETLDVSFECNTDGMLRGLTKDKASGQYQIYPPTVKNRLQNVTEEKLKLSVSPAYADVLKKYTKERNAVIEKQSKANTNYVMVPYQRMKDLFGVAFIDKTRRWNAAIKTINIEDHSMVLEFIKYLAKYVPMYEAGNCVPQVVTLKGPAEPNSPGYAAGMRFVSVMNQGKK